MNFREKIAKILSDRIEEVGSFLEAERHMEYTEVKDCIKEIHGLKKLLKLVNRWDDRKY